MTSAQTEHHDELPILTEVIDDPTFRELPILTEVVAREPEESAPLIPDTDNPSDGTEESLLDMPDNTDTPPEETHIPATQERVQEEKDWLHELYAHSASERISVSMPAKEAEVLLQPRAFNAEERKLLLHHLESHLETVFTDKLNSQLIELQRLAVDLAVSELKADLPRLLRDALIKLPEGD